ncbi:MAG: tetratricopeptide repeat protein [Candidatus Hodarchaeales archaeon]
MEQFKIAIKINPDYAAAHYNLGVIYQDQGLTEKANVHFKRAKKLNPSVFGTNNIER